jgi:hypothetical protein
VRYFATYAKHIRAAATNAAEAREQLETARATAAATAAAAAAAAASQSRRGAAPPPPSGPPPALPTLPPFPSEDECAACKDGGEVIECESRLRIAG